MLVRACLAWFILAALVAAGEAGTLIGKLEMPPAPKQPPQVTHGFLDRFDNPLAPVRDASVTPQMVIVLEGGDTPVSPPQVNWELVGESFSRPVVAAPTGAEVVIKNMSKAARTLVAKEDPKLIQGPLNPTGPKSFHVTEAGKTYTFGDPDAPHLRGKLVVVNTQFIAYPDELGRFDINDIPAGSYKLKVWYRDGWIEGAVYDLNISAKGKTDYNPKLPAGAFAPAAKK